MQVKILSLDMKKYLIITAIVEVVALAIFIIVETEIIPDENTTSVKIEKLHNNQDLICINNKSIFSNRDRYIVSLKRNWKIYNGDYVAKNDFAIKLKNCD